jgi:hypothetical protein
MEHYTGGFNMGCSINIIRRPNPKSEVRYVETEPIHYYYDDENDEEFDIQFILSDLYEKIGYLKRRVEELEAKQ